MLTLVSTSVPKAGAFESLQIGPWAAEAVGYLEVRSIRLGQ